MADARKIMLNVGAFFDTVGITALAFPLWYMVLGPMWEEYHPDGIDTDTWQNFANWGATNYSWASHRAILVTVLCFLIGRILEWLSRPKQSDTTTSEK